MTIEKWIKGKIRFELTSDEVEASLASRSIPKGTLLADVDERDRDLLRADLLVLLSTVPSGGGRRVQKGNRSVNESTYTFGVYDRRYFEREANRLYAKWGEQKKISSVKFVTFRNGR